MKKFKNFVTLTAFLICASALTGCFSLLKADKLTYVGTMGKRVELQQVDSISQIEIQKTE